jgi:predicted small secreted protein
MKSNFMFGLVQLHLSGRSYSHANGNEPFGGSLERGTDMETTKKNATRMIALIASGCLAAAAGLSMTGCNTVEGVGEDVESAGDAVSDTARDAKD